MLLCGLCFGCSRLIRIDPVLHHPVIAGVRYPERIAPDLDPLRGLKLASSFFRFSCAEHQEQRAVGAMNGAANGRAAAIFGATAPRTAASVGRVSGAAAGAGGAAAAAIAGAAIALGCASPAIFMVFVFGQFGQESWRKRSLTCSSASDDNPFFDIDDDPDAISAHRSALGDRKQPCYAARFSLTTGRCRCFL